MAQQIDDDRDLTAERRKLASRLEKVNAEQTKLAAEADRVAALRAKAESADDVLATLKHAAAAREVAGRQEDANELAAALSGRLGQVDAAFEHARRVAALPQQVTDVEQLIEAAREAQRQLVRLAVDEVKARERLVEQAQLDAAGAALRLADAVRRANEAQAAVVREAAALGVAVAAPQPLSNLADDAVNGLTDLPDRQRVVFAVQRSQRLSPAVP